MWLMLALVQSGRAIGQQEVAQTDWPTNPRRRRRRRAARARRTRPSRKQCARCAEALLAAARQVVLTCAAGRTRLLPRSWQREAHSQFHLYSSAASSHTHHYSLTRTHTRHPCHFSCALCRAASCRRACSLRPAAGALAVCRTVRVVQHILAEQHDAHRGPAIDGASGEADGEDGGD
eukprot:scaffold287197_cov32-Tisochrysis_lutea.AAC.3